MTQQSSFIDIDTIQKEITSLTVALSRAAMAEYKDASKVSRDLFKELNNPAVSIDNELLFFIDPSVNIEKVHLDAATRIFVPLLMKNLSQLPEIKDMALLLTENRFKDFWLSFAHKSEGILGLIEERNRNAKSHQSISKSDIMAFDTLKTMSIYSSKIRNFYQENNVSEERLKEALTVFLTDVVKNIEDSLNLKHVLIQNELSLQSLPITQNKIAVIDDVLPKIDTVSVKSRQEEKHAEEKHVSVIPRESLKF